MLPNHSLAIPALIGDASKAKEKLGWEATVDGRALARLMVDADLESIGYEAKPWQKPHEPNKTGTSQAYRPDGSILTPAKRPHGTGDYQAWRPE